MKASAFVLDANVFIEAARRYYAFDLAPGFWESLIHHAENRRVQSIDRVRHELERGDDQLATWAKEDFAHGFASTDEDAVIQSYGKVMTWVQEQSQFMDAAKAEFANGADGWLVAYAKAKACIVVTQEELSLDAKRRVPIPNICKHFDVPNINTFEMLRRLKVRWAR